MPRRAVALSDSTSNLSTQSHHVLQRSAVSLAQFVEEPVQRWFCDGSISQCRAICGRRGGQEATQDIGLCHDYVIWHVEKAPLSMRSHPGNRRRIITIRGKVWRASAGRCFITRLPAYHRFPLERVGPALIDHRKRDDRDPECHPECGDGRVAVSRLQWLP